MDASELVKTFTSIDPSLKAGIVSFIGTLSIGLIKFLLEPRSKVIWGIAHEYWFNLPQEDGSIALVSRDIYVANHGRGVAENVQVALNFKPRHIEIWPPVEHEHIVLPDGRPLLKFRKLPRKDYFIVHMLEIGGELPNVLYIKSDEGGALSKNFAPNFVFPRWFNQMVVVMFTLGIFASFYFIIRLIQFVSS